MSEATNAATTAEAAAETPTINITDLQNILKIIDAAAGRGAFRGDELSAVGSVRDKLAKFLDALPKKEADQSAEGGAASEAGAE